jgi:hypothetical protein
MTHTLHRRGPLEDLKQEFVVLAMAAKDVNRDGSAPKLAKILEIYSHHHPVIFGNVAANSMKKDISWMIDQTKDNTVVHAVFNNEKDLSELLAELKEADLGISVVVSGLFDRVGSCCCRAGIKPHTVNMSLGVWGNTSRLPSEDILQIETMCGHNMISASLIEDRLDKVRRGIMTPERAARDLAKNCHCGIFNWERAARVFGRIIDKEKSEKNK